MAEAMRSEKLDFIGIQETIKDSFSEGELWSVGGDDFDWKWLPAQGHSGGILLGTRKETFEVARFSAGQFFVSADLIQRNNRTHWELIVVYGPADHLRSVSFLTELHDKISGAMHPVVVGGDFNLMRSPEDKSKN